MTSTLVYSRTDSGHKFSYARLFARLLEADVLHRFGRSRTSVIGPLLRAERVLFLTLDDDIPTFIIVALLRRLRGRSTTGLYLRPQFCFAPGAAARVKRTLFGTFRAMRFAKVFVILPFDAASDYSKIATDWVYDPEMWDLDLLYGAGPLPDTELTRKIVAQAAGRPIVFLLGDFLERKGGEFLTKLLETAPNLAEFAFFVSVGRIGIGSEELALRFKRAGGWILGRRTTDEELASLYCAGTAAWSCYSAAYDQASGIFGRAVQTACPTIVREGSQLQRIAAKLDHPVIAIAFEPTPQTAKHLKMAISALPPRDDVATVDVASNQIRRDEFLNKIKDAMQG